MQDLYDNLAQFIKDLDYENNQFPQWYEFGFQDSQGNTALMYWCQYRIEPIPSVLFEEVGTCTNELNTALMNYIMCREREPIPEELFSEVSIINKYGETPLMCWCANRMFEPIPEELLIHIGYKDEDNRTASRIWRESMYYFSIRHRLPDCLKPEETMELIPFVPHEYRTKTLDFKLL